MANNTIVSTPPFQDPQLLNFAKQIINALNTGGGSTTVGVGNPVVTRGITEGDTYWDTVGNNWWIFNSGQWTQLNTGFSVDTTTGTIKDYNGNIYSWLYQYLAIKYADTDTGGGFSDSPIGKTYYGVNNSNSSSESSDPADYLWTLVPGGFGTTKSLWYQVTGGRQLQIQIATSTPGTGWVVDAGTSIDLDTVTSGNIPVVAEAFVTSFILPTIQVPRTGSTLTPVFTGINPTLTATNKGALVPFVASQDDSDSAFVNNTWRIGNSSTTGYGDISHTNLTIGDPTVDGNSAKFPTPTAMSTSPVFITVPIRYKSDIGVVTQASIAACQLVFVDPGAQGDAGPVVDFNGYTSFVQNVGGAFTPTSATLSAVTTNVTSPTYAWAITGATPTTGGLSTIAITPNSSATSVSVTLTVSGSNLSSPLTITKILPVVYDGATGSAGANGVMSAFPTIYQWTTNSTPPTRPTTTSTFTWSTATFTAPSGWYTQAPTNTTAGSYLWAITVPLNVSATTTTSTLDWTNTGYAIRAIAYNGADGTNGTNGINGATGATGSSGSATFLVTRTANDSSAPSNAEVTAAIGRNPVVGDIVTVNYNAGNNAVVYRFTTSWITQATYLTGSLIVQGTITGDRLVSNTVTADKINAQGLSILDTSGNTVLSAGSSVATSTFAGNATGTVAGTAAATLVSTANTANSTANTANSTANTALSNAATAQTTANAKLAKSGADILTGPISMNAASAILVGTTSDGLYLGNTGIVGKKAGATTFAVDQAGNATFGGNLTAATGTFTGDLTGTVAGTGASTLVSTANNANSTANTANSTANTALTNAATAQTSANSKLSKSGSDILAGPISLSTTNAILVGSSTDGVVVGSSGIAGHKAGVTTFAVDQAGNAFFGGNLEVGSSPAISGTTMTGAGAVINSNGTFALGNASTNITYEGTQLSLNGNVVATGNMNSNAVTNSAYVTPASDIYVIPLSASGSRVAILIFYQISQYYDGNSGPPTGTCTYNWTDGTYTAPSTAKGWSAIPPRNTNIAYPNVLNAYVVVYSDNGTSSTSTVDVTQGIPMPSLFSSISGSNISLAVLPVYYWSTTIYDPLSTVAPSGTSVYAWANNTFTDPASLGSFTHFPTSTIQGSYLKVFVLTKVVTGTLPITTTFTWPTTANSIPIAIGGTVSGKLGEVTVLSGVIDAAGGPISVFYRQKLTTINTYSAGTLRIYIDNVVKLPSFNGGVTTADANGMLYSSTTSSPSTIKMTVQPIYGIYTIVDVSNYLYMLGTKR